MSGVASGDLDSTGAAPRRINGTFWLIATARSGTCGFLRDGSAASARLSQPSAVPMGCVRPFSSTFWPSKCDRSRYGEATA